MQRKLAGELTGLLDSSKGIRSAVDVVIGYQQRSDSGGWGLAAERRSAGRWPAVAQTEGPCATKRRFAFSQPLTLSLATPCSADASAGQVVHPGGCSFLCRGCAGRLGSWHQPRHRQGAQQPDPTLTLHRGLVASMLATCMQRASV